MAIIAQKKIFSWEEVDELGDLDRLPLVLKSLPDEALMQAMEVAPTPTAARMILAIIGSPRMGTMGLGTALPPRARRSPSPAAMIPALMSTVHPVGSGS